MSHYAGLTALVTGASRGIGAAMARELARRGIQELILSARSEEDLNALAEELRTSYTDLAVNIVVADLAASDGAASLVEYVKRRGLAVDILVNNAGFGAHGLFDEADAAKDAAMIAVNVDALVALTHAFLPGMISRNRGGVINVASTAGLIPIPYMSVYGATKAFVLSFSEGLWVELKDKGANVRMLALCPGNTSTNFGEGMHRGNFESGPQDTPESVVVAGLNAYERGDNYTVVGWGNYVTMQSARLLPRAMAAKVAGAATRPPELKPAKTTPDGRGLLLATGGAMLGLALTVILTRRKRRS